jgi:hypothetical protein
MDWYLACLGTVPVSGVMKTLDGTSMDWNMQDDVHQKYIRYIINARCWLTKNREYRLINLIENVEFTVQLLNWK